MDTQQLVKFPEVSAIEFFEYEKVDELIGQIKEAALAEVFDCSTAKGRASCKAQAHKVSKSKVHLANLAKLSIEEHSAIVKSVTAERRRIEQELDSVRDEVKKPALEWEAKEEQRIERHRSGINSIKHFSSDAHNLNSVEIDNCIKQVEDFVPSTFEEFEQEAKDAISVSLEVLNARKEALIEQAKKDAELERLREVEAKAKAEEAKREEEAKAKALEEARIAAELAAAEKAKELAIQHKKDAEEAEARRVVEEKARIEQAKEDAIKSERERIAKEQAELEAKKKADQDKEEAKKRDFEHREKIRKAAIDSILERIELSQESAQYLIEGIEQGVIANITLNF